MARHLISSHSFYADADSHCASFCIDVHPALASYPSSRHLVSQKHLHIAQPSICCLPPSPKYLNTHGPYPFPAHVSVPFPYTINPFLATSPCICCLYNSFSPNSCVIYPSTHMFSALIIPSLDICCLSNSKLPLSMC